MRGDEYKLTVSEFEHVLGIAKDGTYRVMNALEKVFHGAHPRRPLRSRPGRRVHRRLPRQEADPLCQEDQDREVHPNREYQLVKDKEGKVDLLLPADETGRIQMDFVLPSCQRLKEAVFDLGELGPRARRRGDADRAEAGRKAEARARSEERGKKASGGAKGARGSGAARGPQAKRPARTGEQGDLF
ncbi:MAG: hypothetical protein R3E53_07855 [Myxococcota bacterium]